MLRRSRYGRRRKPRLGPLTGDPILIAAALLVALLGGLNLVVIGSTDQALHQWGAVGIGLVALHVARRARRQSWAALAWATYAAAVILLAAVIMVGVSANGARRWVTLGSLVLQPSELAKLGLLLLLANLLGNPKRDDRFVVPLALVLSAVPIALTMLEPDLSTSSLLVVVTVGALVLARVRFRVLVPLAAGMIGVALTGERFLRPYQAARLHAFLSGKHDLGAGWSLLQAHIAVASGGVLGIWWQDPNHQLLAQYLPERETDLAFASLIEQWGLVAGIVAVGAMVVIVWRLTVAARKARTFGGGLLAGTLAVLVGAETAISVAGNLGVLPLAGVPFPLLSFGGTAAVAHLAAFGMVLGVRREEARMPLWQPVRQYRRRPRLVGMSSLGVTVGLALLLNFTYQLQVQGAGLRIDAVNEMTRCIGFQAPRGAILDRHGAVVAEDVALDDVLVSPALVAPDPEALTALAALLGQQPGKLLKLLATSGDPMWMNVSQVSKGKGKQIAEKNIAGVLVVPARARHYPTGPLLAPLLGYVGLATPEDVRDNPGLPGNEIVGRAGIEQQYDWVLRGQDGRACLYVDPQGHPQGVAGITPAHPGTDILLSIDLELQKVADAALKKSLGGLPRGEKGDLGAAIVMDPRTGQILAMASEPSFDNNVFGPPVDETALRRLIRQKGLPMLEHATQISMPPGSTFKLVVASADARFNAIPPAKVIPTGYTFTLGGHVFHGWESLPPQNLPSAIAWSNDVYFYKLALALGPMHIYDTATALGVGKTSGIDLPGEISGYLGNPQTVTAAGGTWYAGSTVILGIGQGYITVTPLQVARWTAGIATGSMVTPTIGLAYRSDELGGSTALTTPTVKPVPFQSKLGVVRQGMRMAVQQGTANQLRKLPVPAGGKTGTAEDPAAPNHEADAWFTAVAPMPNPEVTVTVVVRGGGEGYYTSEPAATTILQHYFSHRAAIQSHGFPGGGSHARAWHDMPE